MLAAVDSTGTPTRIADAHGVLSLNGDRVVCVGLAVEDGIRGAPAGDGVGLVADRDAVHIELRDDCIIRIDVEPVAGGR